MIFGQPAGPQQRVPFQRPPQANAGYAPRMIRTGFQTHLNPFSHVMSNMVGKIPRNLATASHGQMQPGAPRVRQGVVAQSLPAVIPEGCPTCAPGGPLPTAAPVPAATNGFGYSFAAAAGHRRPQHQHVSPYLTMRSGAWPGIRSSGAGMRAGAWNAGRMIKRLMPAGYPNVARPAGGYRPLRALPAAMPAPAATNGFGRCVWVDDGAGKYSF